MPITVEDIVSRVTYHAPSQLGVERHAALSDAIETAMTLINAVCPDGREKALAFTHLEEAKFWSSAAVARNPETR